MAAAEDGRHYEALDGVRGLAALSVVCGHFDGLFWINNGWIGVDVFFVLSGFLITRLLLADMAQDGTIRFRRFYMRRVLRLMPALVLMVASFVGIEVVLREHDLRSVLLAAIAALTYTINWLRATNALNAMEFSHAWTLAIEEQFYLTLPLLLIVTTPLLGKIGRLAAILVLTVVVYAHRMELIATGVSENWIFFAFHTRCGGLLVGVAAALCVDLKDRGRLAKSGERALTAGATAGWAMILFALVVPVGNLGYLVGLEPFVVVGTALLLAHLVTTEGSVIAHALSIPPLVRVGKVSYGLYLWHYPIWIVFWPAVAWLNIPAGLHQAVDLCVLLPLSFVACGLSYRYVELPFLALRNRAAAPQAPGRPAPVTGIPAA